MIIRVTLEIEVPDSGLKYIDTEHATPRRKAAWSIVREHILTHVQGIPILEDADAIVRFAS